MPRFSRSNPLMPEYWEGKHRFEHWYRDNQVYLITSKTRNGVHVFRSEEAKAVFWDRFNYYTVGHGFAPWITTLLNNHYHTVGYLKVGVELKEMMRKIHGSVAKLTNDLLEERVVPFWGDKENRDYFDGCLRDETQLIRSYNYVLRQAQRHGICRDYRRYEHTRVGLSLDDALMFARAHRALMYGVPYARYERRQEHERRRLRRARPGNGT